MAFKKNWLKSLRHPSSEYVERETFPAFRLSSAIVEQPYTSSHASPYIKSYFLVYISAESLSCLEISFYYEDRFSQY